MGRLRGTAAADVILAEAARRLHQPSRRMFLRRAVGLGTLSLLTGCDVIDGDSAELALGAISNFNDRVQAWLFSPHRMAREYPPEAITRPFPFNAFYPRDQAPRLSAAEYRLEVGGAVEQTAPWTVEQLRALPAFSQITRHICIEGWSAIGHWRGPRFSEFLARIGADRQARYVTFRCADGCATAIDMPTALHPQTQLALWFDGGVLPQAYGFPIKLRVPTKLGFKNPKHIVEITIGNQDTGGYWETYGYNRFSGL